MNAHTTPAQGSRLLLETLGDVRPVRRDPLKHAMDYLVLGLANLPIPKIPASPEPEDFEWLAYHLERFAMLADDYVKAVGDVLNANTSHRVNLGMFRNQVSGALQGNATYECTRAAEILREDRGG